MRNLLGIGIMMAGLTVLPLAAQSTSDPNRPAGDATTTRQTDNDNDNDFNLGWLGLLGLAGLTGLRRKAPEVITRTEQGNTRTYTQP